MTGCHRCGKCCQVLPCNPNGLPPETRQWLIARGAVYSEDGKYILLPHVCIQLNPDNSCKLHDTPDYPVSCKRYHGHGNYYKPPGCGYLE